MVALVAKFRRVAGALALLALAALGPPAAAQQPNSVDPTTSAVHEDQLLQQFKTIQGRGSIPDTKSYTIEQPAGSCVKPCSTCCSRDTEGSVKSAR